MEAGGGASRSTEPAHGTSQATDVSLREFIEQRFVALEDRLDERRGSDLQAVKIAKETADAALEAHNELIKQMRAQAIESQRQLDKLTDTYATKENLKTLETLIDQRLISIDGKLQGIESSASEVSSLRQGARGAWADLKGVVMFGFLAVGFLIGVATYFAQQ